MTVHKELITSGKFDDKFKRALLDYYSYGFKNMTFYDHQTHQTILTDWYRLNRVISDYLKWSDPAELGEIMFATTDSQSMKTNPFHRVYRFCKHNPNYPFYFLHTIAALSPAIKLRGGIEFSDLDEEQQTRLENLITAEHPELKTSDLILFYKKRDLGSDDNNAAGKKKIQNKALTIRLSDLACLGLIKSEQKEGKAGGKGDHRWTLPQLSMRKLLDSGYETDVNFERHLYSALDFFSRYYLFGEVGTFLLDRIDTGSPGHPSPFRFKHEYLMQSLNDFNILDLLYAIEEGKWCKIKYRHGTAGFENELLCYPLEIRISNMQGREFLMFYEPFRRSYTALRIEFIDSIELYEDQKIKKFLTQAGYHTSPETIDADIANARKSIPHSWGVSTTKRQEKNAVKPVETHPVSLRIAYDPAKEYYIVNRLNRECRSGTVRKSNDDTYFSFTIDVSDEKELRPWVRSFYSRILTCEGMDSDDFSFDKDVEAVMNLFLTDKLSLPRTETHSKPSSIWGIPDEVKNILGKGSKATAHELLFNENFSIYYYIITDFFTQLSSDKDEIKYTDKELKDIIRNSCNKYSHKIGEETKMELRHEIKELFFDPSNGFIKKTEKKYGRKRRESHLNLAPKQ